MIKAKRKRLPPNMPPPLRVRGYVGVVNGRPQFGEVCDDHGDQTSIDVYKKREDALERWANVRRCEITIFPGEIPQSPSRGKL